MITLKPIKKFPFLASLSLFLTVALDSHLNAQTPQTLPNSNAVWQWEDAQKIELNSSNTIPSITNYIELAPDAEIWTWDSWVLRNRDGSLAQINGYYVLFSLIASRTLAPEERHNNARIGYWYSKNAKDWTFAGEVFPQEDALGSRQWSGGAIYDQNKLYLFYTAVGRKGDPEISFEQQIALATANITPNEQGVKFSDWLPHQIVLEPQGVYYQSQAQSLYTPDGVKPPAPGPEGNDTSDGGNRIIYSFRDPWIFQDPNDGQTYMLFATNTPGVSANKRCSEQSIGDVSSTDVTIPQATVEFNGSVGLAVAPDPNNLYIWKPLPSIFHAECVNQQLELPRFVFKDGKYYLFIASHQFTFPKGLRETGLDALYGFVSDSLYGNYEPLNESGLVLGNPSDNPIQTFAWVILPNEVVLSFINYTNLGDVDPQNLHLEPLSFQREKFGGTLAPSIQIEIDGNQTRMIQELGQGELLTP